MTGVAVLLTVLICVALLIRDARRIPAPEIAVSHFWYFTLIFLFAYPFRAWLIESGMTVPQVVHKNEAGGGFHSGAYPLTDMGLGIAVLVSLGFWSATYLGYSIARHRDAGSSALVRCIELSDSHLYRATVFHIIMMIAALAATMYLNPYGQVSGGAEHALRAKGAGGLWLLQELFVLTFILVVAVAARSPERVNVSAAVIILLTTISLAAFETYVLASRRVLAGIIISAAVGLVIANRRFWPVGLAAALGTFYAANLFEIVRNIRAPLDLGYSYWDAFIYSMDRSLDQLAVFLFSTSFEGAEHVLQLLRKFDYAAIIGGVDQGLAWIFNAGLAFVPRSIWVEKPIVYGGIEQFQALYPGYFEGGINSTSIPVGFVVDLSYGYGILFGLILAFFLGRFFALCQLVIAEHDHNLFLLAVSLATFALMFNIIRGGSIHIQIVWLVLVMSIVISGVRSSFYGLHFLLFRVIHRPFRGISVGPPAG